MKVISEIRIYIYNCKFKGYRKIVKDTYTHLCIELVYHFS